jgi:flagellar biogenesis protein FliO
MSTKIIAAELPSLAEASPFARHLRTAIRFLSQKFTRSASSAEHALAVEDRVALGPKKSLFVVRCHGRHFLVAAAGDTIGPLIEVAPRKPARCPRKEPQA